jgi:hypothetical protein
MSGATIVDTILSRAVQEHWTAEDVLSAYFQCSLLSYRSTPETPGPRYIRSAPEDYVHNCPWNDWTPPSVSERLFEVANSNSPSDPVRRRVRVHVVASARADEQRLIAFATVEKNAHGKDVLVLRRGADILGSQMLCRIDVRPDPTDKMIRKILISSATGAHKTTTNGVLSTYLRFEDDTKLYAFDAMINCADKPR